MVDFIVIAPMRPKNRTEKKAASPYQLICTSSPIPRATKKIVVLSLSFISKFP